MLFKAASHVFWPSFNSQAAYFSDSVSLSLMRFDLLTSFLRTIVSLIQPVTIWVEFWTCGGSFSNIYCYMLVSVSIPIISYHWIFNATALISIRILPIHTLRPVSFFHIELYLNSGFTVLWTNLPSHIFSPKS